MEAPIFKPKLPIMGNSDGDHVIDQNGSQYEFNSELNEWIFQGQIADPGVVTEDSDGLVSPDIYSRLTLIRDLMGRGVDFSRFKLDSPVQNPYYYLFHSSDDLIRFIPERHGEPKEVKFVGLVAGVDAVGETTVLTFENINSFSALAFVGLVLETGFGSFNIVSNAAFTVTVAGTQVSVRVGDRVKVVKPEVISTKLRIEVDNGRLYQKLIRNCCVGPKGASGNSGDDGTPGSPSGSEVFELPLSTVGGVFSWSTLVDTPIGTPISFRVFRGGDDVTVVIEVLFPLDGGPVLVSVNDDAVDVGVTSGDISYSVTSRVFEGSFSVFSDEDIGTWRFKVRQRGPKGNIGVDGLSFLEVATEVLDDSSLRGTDAIISLRKSTISDDVIFLRNELFEEIPTANLGALAGGSVVDAEVDLFVSAEVTINESKNIGFFNFQVPSVVVPPLDIPSWTPTGDCVQSRRWALYKYDWFNRVEPNYLFDILLNPKPDPECCQESYFFCPNVGDEPCSIEGIIKTPVPIPTPCSCDCENPIGDQFGGEGFIMPPLDLTDPQNAFEPVEPDVIINLSDFGSEASALVEQLNEQNEGLVEDSSFVSEDNTKASAIGVVESVIDGTINRFIQDITGVGNIQIDVTIDLDSDVCGGDMKERASCAFVDSDAFRSLFVLESLTDDVAITSSTMQEVKIIPATVRFTASTEKNVLPDVPPVVQPGDIVIPVEEGNVPDQVVNPEFCTANFAISTLRLRSTINTTEVNYCRGYRLTVTVKSDRVDPSKERTFIVTQPNSVIIPIEDVIVDGGTGGTGGSVGSGGSLGTGVTGGGNNDGGGPIVPAEPSFAPDGSIISGGAKPEEIIASSSYALGFDIVKHVISATGNPSIFYDPEDHSIGFLLSAPSESQVPLIFDQLHNNCVISVPRFVLNKNDAGFDVNGPLGRGTYILGDNFATVWSSRIPFTQVRTDSWVDVVAFFDEPDTSNGPFNVVVLARLSSSVLHDSASSVFADSLFASGVSDGILVIEGLLQDDPMGIISDGSITFSEYGRLTVTYSSDISSLYPDVIIDAMSVTGV